MIEPHDPWLRFLFVLVVTAVAINIVVSLIAPVLPWFAIVVLAVAGWRLWRWWREGERW